MALDERRERRPSQKRRVAGQHDDVALVEVGRPIGAGQTRERHRDRVAGSARFELLDELDGEVPGSFGLDGLYDLGRSMADDDHDPLHGQRAERIENVQDHRTPAQPVQRLRRARPHPRAFARGEHDGRERTTVHGPIVHLLADFASAFSSRKEQCRGSLVPASPRCSQATSTISGKTSVVGALSSYVAIPCLSPDFDPAWADNGEIGRAARLLCEWAASRPLPGCTVEVVEREGLTPAIIADVPATPGAATRLVTLLYGHLDKQPPLGSWRKGLDPFVAVREGERLYGRGAADDGYSIFAAIGALEALAATGTPHGRCVVLIEASEESGSPHLGPYLEEVGARIGVPGPGLVVCLDSGCATYDRLWSTNSLRGSLVVTLSVEVLSEGVHSGLAGGIVPSSFRLLRQLLSRIEDEATGEILVPECLAETPARYRAAAEAMAAELGEAALGEFPTVPSLEFSGRAGADRLLRRTWMPSLAVIGIDGVPSVKDGGNVLRPFTTAKLSLRLPPAVDADRAAEAVVQHAVGGPAARGEGESSRGERGEGFRRTTTSGMACARHRRGLGGSVRTAGGGDERRRDDPVSGRARVAVPRSPVPRHRRARAWQQRTWAERDARLGDSSASHRRGSTRARVGTLISSRSAVRRLAARSTQPKARCRSARALRRVGAHSQLRSPSVTSRPRTSPSRSTRTTAST